MRRVLVLLCLCAALSGCGGQVDPSLGMHLGRDGTVTPSLAGTAGGVTLGASPHGGYLGTRLGPIRLSAGL